MKRYLTLIAAILLLAAILCGCSSEVNDQKTEAAYAVEETMASYGYSSYKDYEISAEIEVPADTAVRDNRKLIKTVSLTVETEDFDNMLSDLEARISTYGGYVESVNVNSRYASSQRYANYMIRIPAEQVDAFVDHVGSNCNVLTRSERQEDVTLQYVDTQSECAALRVEQERLMELLETAENLSDILEIESRLTQIRYRLESVESQLRTYDNQISYATVNLTVNEVEVYTPTEEKGFWEALGDGLVSSTKGVWKLLKSVFYLFVVALPYLLVIGVIVGMVLLLTFYCIRRHKRKQQNKPQM